MSFFGIRNVDLPHWERLTLFMTLISSSQSISCLNVTPFMCGTLNGFTGYGSASGLSLIRERTDKTRNKKNAEINLFFWNHLMYFTLK